MTYPEAYRGEGAKAPRIYYEDEWVTLWHGDCARVLECVAFDAIVSDPPYGMAYKHGARRGGRAMGMDGESIAGDDRPFDPEHLLRKDVPTILWGGNHFAGRLPSSPGWLVWDKRDGRPSNDQSDAELAWTNFLRVARVHRQHWSGNVRSGREQREGRSHVNQKPVALMSWCIALLPNPKPQGVICDPYAGSGSTLLAAREAGWRAIGIELEERYCEIAARRLDQGVLDFGALA